MKDDDDDDDAGDWVKDRELYVEKLSASEAGGSSIDTGLDVMVLVRRFTVLANMVDSAQSTFATSFVRYHNLVVLERKFDGEGRRTCSP